MEPCKVFSDVAFLVELYPLDHSHATSCFLSVSSISLVGVGNLPSLGGDGGGLQTAKKSRTFLIFSQATSWSGQQVQSDLTFLPVCLIAFVGQWG